MADGYKVEMTGAEALQGFFKKMAAIERQPSFKQEMVNSAVIIERAAKINLKKMVYDKPEKGYKRTRKLFNSTMASKKIDWKIGEVITAVVSYIFYAVYVHMGTIKVKGTQGWYMMKPRPYFTKALQDSKDEILKRFSNIFK